MSPSWLLMGSQRPKSSTVLLGSGIGLPKRASRAVATSRGGAVAPVESDWKPQLIAIVEFPSIERAHTWYRPPEYAEALKLRQKALRRRLIFVEGMAPA